MPIIQITLARGRTADQLKRLGEELTAAVERSIEAPRASIRVILSEVDPDLFFVAGRTIADRRADDVATSS
jgi:4-oxalocrotonate tautomerase